jgi:hypothetical protein
MPIKNNWTDEKKNTPITNGAMPTENLSQKISL